MTEQDQIKAIAELDGWIHYNQTWESPSGSRYADRVKRLTSNSPLELVPLDQILPNYLTSYDAIIPVIQKQHPGVQKHLYYNLCEILHHYWRQIGIDTGKFSEVEWTIACMIATPAQLCEALLRATGKWTE